jgi:hypothetical protein
MTLIKSQFRHPTAAAAAGALALSMGKTRNIKKHFYRYIHGINLQILQNRPSHKYDTSCGLWISFIAVLVASYGSVLRCTLLETPIDDFKEIGRNVL